MTKKKFNKKKLAKKKSQNLNKYFECIFFVFVLQYMRSTETAN